MGGEAMVTEERWKRKLGQWRMDIVAWKEGRLQQCPLSADEILVLLNAVEDLQAYARALREEVGAAIANLKGLL